MRLEEQRSYYLDLLAVHTTHSRAMLRTEEIQRRICKSGVQEGKEQLNQAMQNPAMKHVLDSSARILEQALRESITKKYIHNEFTSR